MRPARLSRLIASAAIVLALHGGALAQTRAQDLRTLDALQTLTQQNSARALTALRADATGLARSPDPDVRRTYHSAMIDAAFDAGDMALVGASIAALQALARETGDPGASVLATSVQSRLWSAEGRSREAIEQLRGLRPALLAASDPYTRWMYHLTLGSLLSGSGEFEAALDQVLRSLDLARGLPRQAAMSEMRSQSHLAMVYMDMRNETQARRAIDEAMAMASRLGATQALGWLQLHRGNLESTTGHLDDALVAYGQAAQMARDTGLKLLQASAQNNIGDIHLRRQAYALAEPVMREALAAYRATGQKLGAAVSQANLGYALMGQGQIEAGVREVLAGIGVVHEAGARTTEEDLLGELSRMYERAGLYREAMATTREQQALARDLFRIEREQAVGALQARFDAVQRQRQLDQLALDNRVKDAELGTRRTQQLALGAAAALTLLGGGVVFLLYRRSRAANAALRVAQGQAEEALQDKNLFLATASHDLRQPIHAMSLMVEAIGLRNRDASVKPLLAELRHNMGALSQLFNALLDLSRLESGRLKARIEAVPLAPLLGEVARELREAASLAGVRLRLRLPRRDAVVVADRLLLRQAVLNLAHNAIRYAPGGQVLVGARARGDGWQIEVWDTGIGIAAEERPQVFDPYYRSDHARRADHDGHGLGLAVVARSARLMGATHGLHSRLGKGSRFWIGLPASPVARTRAAPAAMDEAPEHADAAPLKGRCLVLDDEPHVLTAWRALFESWGVDARCVSSGDEARRQLAQGFAPQAILCDLRLRAGESGFDVLRDLLSRCPEAGGALVSGEFGSEALEAAEEDGYLVLHKPVDPEALHALLSTWFAQRTSPST